MPRFSLSYKEALAWLYGTQRFGIKLGLENVRRLFSELELLEPSRTGAFQSALGGSETAAPWRPKIIHVAGTNGKGSVCAMIDSILRAQGYRTGLFTSPHLITFRERIQINGEMISRDDVAHGLTMIRNLIADWEPHPTFFEITTALALLHFQERETEFIVLETGMGGRLDATNIINPIVSVITPIDLDHQKWLGDSLTKIAGEKAGIIKANTPVVSAIQPAEAQEVIRARAAECNAPLQFVKPDYPHRVGLDGIHQKQNAALAVAALRAAKMGIAEEIIAHGIENVRWPARFQRWDERTVIDGAHNPSGARLLAQTWGEAFGHKRGTIILAILADKDVEQICCALAPIADRFLLPQIRSERALAPSDLASVLRNISPEISSEIHVSFAEAWNEARQTIAHILITGSLHFAGEALAELERVPAAYEECAQ